MLLKNISKKYEGMVSINFDVGSLNELECDDKNLYKKYIDASINNNF